MAPAFDHDLARLDVVLGVDVAVVVDQTRWAAVLGELPDHERLVLVRVLEAHELVQLQLLHEVIAPPFDVASALHHARVLAQDRLLPHALAQRHPVAAARGVLVFQVEHAQCGVDVADLGLPLVEHRALGLAHLGPVMLLARLLFHLPDPLVQNHLRCHPLGPLQLRQIQAVWTPKPIRKQLFPRLSSVFLRSRRRGTRAARARCASITSG
mmetsp:Transcript_7279/g.16921  ORF Transcript_7279/g.16921 Transcript_7279/m.16921 type:complete len:211 (-) Transcript_7279:59-691(-)